MEGAMKGKEYGNETEKKVSRESERRESERITE